MADASHARTSFLGGEWSLSAQGRFDRPDYLTALNVCRNAFPVETGTWTRRPGTRHAGITRNGSRARLFSFDFKEAQPYILELTAATMRFRSGAALATTDDDQVISSISAANPAVVTTAAAHGWATGQAVRFAGLGSGMPLLQARLFTATVTGANTLTIADEITQQGIDGSTLGALPAGATVQRIQEVATPYSLTSLPDVRMVQTELTAILLHPDIQPQVLTAAPPLPGQTYFTFTLAPAIFVDGPYLDPLTNGALISPSAVNGIITLTLSAQAFDPARAYSLGDFVTSSSITYKSRTDQNVGNTPASSPSAWQAVSAGQTIGPSGFLGTDIGRYARLLGSDGSWTWGKITGLQNQISQSLAGAVHIGDMTQDGGLAAAFDSLTTQASNASAGLTRTTPGDPAVCFVGQNFSGASAQKVQSATVWPSSDLGLGNFQKAWITTTIEYRAQVVTGNPLPQWVEFTASNETFGVVEAPSQWILNLRAKASAPASHADGTLLGSVVWTGGPISIPSNDVSTSWNYVWVEVLASGLDFTIPPPVDLRGPITSIGQVTVSQSSELIAVTVSTFVAELQLFAPVAGGAANSVSFQILGPVLPNTSPLPVFRLGAYSDTTGWPSCGTYHEGRLWLSGAIDNRIDGSVSNSTLTFSPTEFTAGRVTDASAIDATFNAPDVNAIFWMVPDQLGIIVGTQAGDWLVQASALNQPLTPTSMQAHRYDRLGCANIEPRRCSGPLMVVHRFRKKLLEYFADVFSGRINAQNVTWQTQHMTAANVAEIAYQNELAPIVWARCDDGSLFGITYKRENLMSSQPPNFSGGHRHTLGSGRVVESIIVGPSVDGLTDSLAMVTKDPVDNVRHVEILTPIFLEDNAVSQAWFLDNAVQASSTVTGANAFTINGLWHLSGQTVTVFAGGLDCGDWLVSNGSIAMTYGDGISVGTGGGLFTTGFISTFGGNMPCVVGFTYNSDGQITRPLSPAESGARTGPALGKKRRVMQFAAMLNSTVGGASSEPGGAPFGIEFGTSFDRLYPALFRHPGGQNYAVGQPFSGIYQNTVPDENSYDGMLCWRIGRPYPASIMAIEQFLQTQDR